MRLPLLNRSTKPNEMKSDQTWAQAGALASAGAIPTLNFTKPHVSATQQSVGVSRVCTSSKSERQGHCLPCALRPVHPWEHALDQYQWRGPAATSTTRVRAADAALARSLSNEALGQLTGRHGDSVKNVWTTAPHCEYYTSGVDCVCGGPGGLQSGSPVSSSVGGLDVHQADSSSGLAGLHAVELGSLMIPKVCIDSRQLCGTEADGTRQKRRYGEGGRAHPAATEMRNHRVKRLAKVTPD
jgi:hypothetical protein